MVMAGFSVHHDVYVLGLADLGLAIVSFSPAERKRPDLGVGGRRFTPTKGG